MISQILFFLRYYFLDLYIYIYIYIYLHIYRMREGEIWEPDVMDDDVSNITSIYYIRKCKDELFHICSLDVYLQLSCAYVIFYLIV